MRHPPPPRRPADERWSGRVRHPRREARTRTRRPLAAMGPPRARQTVHADLETDQRAVVETKTRTHRFGLGPARSRSAPGEEKRSFNPLWFRPETPFAASERTRDSEDRKGQDNRQLQVLNTHRPLLVRSAPHSRLKPVDPSVGDLYHAQSCFMPSSASVRISANRRRRSPPPSTRSPRGERSFRSPACGGRDPSDRTNPTTATPPS